MRWDWWSSSEFVGSLHLCWIAVCNADECTFAWRLQKKKRNNRVLLSAMGLLLLIGCKYGRISCGERALLMSKTVEDL
jgi:hypothetical protein